MGEIWSAVKKSTMVGFKRFLNGDEKFIERNRIQKGIEELEGISRKLDALKSRKTYCKSNEIRTIINNHIKEIRIIIKSIHLQELALREKLDEMALLKDLRKSLDMPIRNGRKALERAEKGEFILVQNEENE